jgi:hypothetical protein
VGIFEASPYAVDVEANTNVGRLSAFLISFRRLWVARMFCLK